MTVEWPSSEDEVCKLVLAECVAALSEAGMRPVGRAYTSAGLIAFDDCCAGQLTVSPERVWRSLDGVAEAVGDECLVSSIMLDLVVILVRCVPVLSDRGVAPSVAAIEEAYGAFSDDNAVIWDALTGELPNDMWLRTSISRQYLGADGGCIGSETRLTLALSINAWGPR